MTLNWKAIKRPYVILSPMAGYTDSAFRQIIKEIAPPVICITELVSADAMAYDSPKSKNLLKFRQSERPHILQLFGKQLDHFKEAVKIAEDLGFDGIDINMGCPARKVVNSMHGSALIQTPCVAMNIVEICAKSSKLPVSVKTRLGWSDDSTLDEFTRQLEDAGAQMITIHGRTSRQMFTGVANWDPIYRIKPKRGVPVTGNGDIRSGQDAVQKLGNLDGVMVGRATVGNPWLMSEVCAALGLIPMEALVKRPAEFHTLKDTILKHCRYNVEDQGMQKGMLEMRKHLASYIRDFQNASKFRAELVQVAELEQVERIMNEIELSMTQAASMAASTASLLTGILGRRME